METGAKEARIRGMTISASLSCPSQSHFATPSFPQEKANARTCESYGHPLKKTEKILNIHTFLDYRLKKVLRVFLQKL